MSAAQGETTAFLKQWLAPSGPVEVIETHISIILLAGKRAFKLKRDVLLPYLDFSTPELRLAACQAELSLNRRSAPELYLGVRCIVQTASGLAIDEAGRLLDAVVEMRRFDEDGVFNRLATRGALSSGLIEALASRIVAFHRAASPDPRFGGAAGIERVLAINEAAVRASRLFDQAEPFIAAFRAAFETHKQALEQRRRAGRVRRCHGDLHLRNICLVGGVPTLFDCIEFSQDLATIDVLYDLAFLLMDLWERQQHAHANLALNRYFDQMDDADALGLIPFFMAIRAAVRAHVLATQYAEQHTDRATKDQAFGYFHLARDLLHVRAPRLVAIGGWSGSGKSSVAGQVAPRLEPAPGARILSSDRMRKRHFGVEPQARLPETAYRSEISALIYAEIRTEAARILAAGHSVVVDAVLDRAIDRAALEAVARQAAVPFDGLWLSAPPSWLVARVAARRHDPSDATVEVVEQQVQRDRGAMTWREIDATGARDETAVMAGEALRL
jgi:aminoglycoside phosphotransferase family enzyme/predicted kinase